MSRWYDGIAGPSPEGKWKRGYEQVNGLLNPLHAHLLGRYLETRDPAVWEALVKSLKKTPWRAEIEHAQKGSLERSQIVGFLTDAMGGGDYAEHMIAAGDPVQLLMTVLPALRGLGVVGGVAKGGLKAGAKGLTSSALLAGGMSVLNTVIQDPNATWEDYQRAAKEGIAAALGLHAGGKVLEKTVGKVVDAGLGKLGERVDKRTNEYRQKSAELDSTHAKPDGEPGPGMLPDKEANGMVPASRQSLYETYPPKDFDPVAYDTAGHALRGELQGVAERLGKGGTPVVWAEPPLTKPGEEAPPLLSIHHDKNGKLQLVVRSDLHRVLWDETGYHPEGFRQKLAALLDEEIIHDSQLRALRERWLKSGQRPGDFRGFVRQQAGEMMADIQQAAQRGTPADSDAIKAAFHATYVTYYKAGYKGAPDVLWKEMTDNPVFFEKATGGKASFLLEFARQALQMKRQGNISETAVQSILTTVQKWIQGMLDALRAGYDLARDGVMGHRMQDFIQRTEGLLRGQLDEGPSNRPD